jgi:hypothetical protein
LFTVAMVQNTGPYAKGWWWYYGQTETEIANHAKDLNARVVNFDIRSQRQDIFRRDFYQQHRRRRQGLVVVLRADAR